MAIIDRITRASRVLFGKRPNLADIELGFSGRNSVDRPGERNLGRFSIIRPDETTNRFSQQNYRIKDIYNKPVSEAIEALIQSSDELRSATTMYMDYAVRKYELTGNTRSQTIVREFLDSMERRGHNIISLWKRFVYGVYVEGAFCGELVFSEDGTEPLFIKYVSPWTMSFEKIGGDDPVYKEEYLVGQYNNTNRLNVLFDPRAPDPTFIYAPYNPLSNKPYGSSQVAPALFGAITMSDLLVSMSRFIQRKVFPKGVFSLLMKPLIDAGYNSQQITAIANKATQALKGQLDGSDITQDIVLPAEVVFTLVGSLERANIDGAEMIVDILERKLQRGLGVPRLMYGGRRQGGGLNDTESRVDWQAFNTRLIGIRDFIEAPIAKFFEQVLIAMGNGGEIGIQFDDTDPEIERIEAEFFDLQMDGFAKLQALRLYSQEELRTKVSQQVPMLTDLGEALPPELRDEPAPVAPALPEPNDNGGDDDE